MSKENGVSKAEVSKTPEDTRRVFEHEGSSYFIDTNPSADVVRQAEWTYTKVFSDAVVGGVLTRSEMVSLLERRGLLGPEHEEEVKRVREELDTKLLELYAARSTNGSDDYVEECAIAVSEIRRRLLSLSSRATEPLSNTCESVAEDARTDFITAHVTRHEDGKMVWPGDKERPSYTAFLDEPNRGLARRAKTEVILWMQGLESDFLNNIPEHVAFREIEERKTAEAERIARELTRVSESLMAETEDESVPSDEVEPITPDVSEDDEKKPSKRKAKA